MHSRPVAHLHAFKYPLGQVCMYMCAVVARLIHNAQREIARADCI
jgi:hypothetical protein